MSDDLIDTTQEAPLPVKARKMTKLEEVCRAICDAEGIDPSLWHGRIRSGEAAIKAMMHPTLVMVQAGFRAAGPGLDAESNPTWHRICVPAGFNAMLAAALAESEG